MLSNFRIFPQEHREKLKKLLLHIIIIYIPHKNIFHFIFSKSIFFHMFIHSQFKNDQLN